MATAITLGRRSRCDLAQVGAFVVSPENQPVMGGYNGPPAGLPVQGGCGGWCPRACSRERSTDYSACESLHAEANALLRADWTRYQGGSIYVSASCCINCARLVAGSGIRRVVHRVTPADAHRHPEEVEAYLRRCGLDVVQYNYESA
jgi:dCMP deaminase